MPTVTNDNIQLECKNASDKIADLAKILSNRIIGRQAKIISDFNGQPVGSSRKSLRGKIITIKAVSVDSWGCDLWDGNFEHCYIPSREVEFLD